MMRIGIAWAKAILPVGLLLVAASAAKAQYEPSPYAPSGPIQPAYYNAANMANMAQPGVAPAPMFADGPATSGPAGVDEVDPLIPYLGQPRVYGTGGIAHPRWFDLSADYMLFTRENAGRFVPYSTLGVGGPVVLSTDNLHFDSSSGFRVTGNYLTGPGRNIEASFFGTFNFAASAQANSNGNLALFSPFSQFGQGALNVDADAANVHRIAYSSNLNSAEVNIRQRYISPNGRVQSSLLAGVRYLSIDEDFEFQSFQGRNHLRYVAQTSNDLVGFQLGGDVITDVLPRFKFGAEAKAGVYGNDAQLRNIITSTPGGLPNNVREADQRNNASFVGEAGIFAIVHITPRFNLKAGYQCLVVTGVALATENFDANPLFGGRPVVVNDGGSVFYHGGQMGFELIW
jgi:hypothetical protein